MNPASWHQYHTMTIISTAVRNVQLVWDVCLDALLSNGFPASTRCLPINLWRTNLRAAHLVKLFGVRV